LNELEPLIDRLWERRAELSAESGGDSRLTVERANAMLDAGVARVAEPANGEWRVNQWLKKAVLLSFRINSMKMIPGGPGGAHWWDKVPSKFAGWSDRQFSEGGFRAVPGAIVRRGA
jgi:2,3,4,5-tetrahydropyridine-2-carboxylate N-succinyltransferase